MRRLTRVIPAALNKPTRAGAEENQRFSRALAADTSLWSPVQAARTIEAYERLAPLWNDQRGGYRRLPVADALSRGGPFPVGPAAEVGSGTGLLTEMLATLWEPVLCLDLSPDMLARSPARYRVRADAVGLPLADATVAAVVLADAPLFASEVVRVLTPDGVVVWSNALGADAPHHVPADDVLAALTLASDRPWSAVTADAAWGLWAVYRRHPATTRSTV